MSEPRCPLCGFTEYPGLVGTATHSDCLPRKHWHAVQALKDSNLNMAAELELLREEDAAQIKLLDMFNAVAGVTDENRPCCWQEQVAVIETFKQGISALKAELERCKARIAELEESDVGRLCKTANAMIVERDHEIARLKAELEKVTGERDRQYDENIARIAAEGKACLERDAALVELAAVKANPPVPPNATLREYYELTQAEPRPEGDANDRD